MNFNFSKRLHYFHFSYLVILAVALAFGTRYFWVTGPVNTENISSVYEASLLLDDIKKRNGIKVLKKNIDNDRVRDSISVMDRLEKDARSLHQVKKINSFDELTMSVKDTKKSITKLLNFPQVSSVLLVLGNKVNNFESFVVQNRWRTLSRMSRRIKAKLQPGRVRTPGFFNYTKLSNLTKSITKDIDYMGTVTKQSVLTNVNKQQVITKLNTLSTEIKMLEKYLFQLQVFNRSFKSLSKRYSNWFSGIEPEITLKRLEMDTNSKHFLFGLLGLFTFTIFGIFFGFFVQRKSVVQGQKQMEKILKNVIQDGLIPFESKLNIKFSPEFRSDLNKFREYVHKRMSFGSIFQDGVPFSSILLDSNLNLVWGNQLFYEHWNLEEKADENVSWDYLQQFTNLGEDDPVLLAHGQGIAGIYQIQVKNSETGEKSPYEMYVSPVQYQGQNRIMIFFYPLRSLEETISNQTKSIVGPISRTLDAMTVGTFDQEFKEKVAKDFDIAGINELYNKFSKHHDFVSQQKSGLLGEIGRLENEVFDQYKVVDDLREMISKANALQEVTINSFEQAKLAIIATIDTRYELEKNYESTIQVAKNMIAKDAKWLDTAQAAGEVIEENKKAFETVSKIREQFKGLYSEVEEFRSQMVRTVEQAVVFTRREDGGDKFCEALNRIKLEIKGFEKTLLSFNEVSTNMNVGLSKVEIVLNSSEVPDFGEAAEWLTSIQRKIEDDMFQLGHISRSGEKFDGEVVGTLKSLYDTFQENRENVHQAETLLTNHRERRDFGEAGATETYTEDEFDEIFVDVEMESEEPEPENRA